MHLFYSPHIQTPEHILSPEESVHCTRVLRLKTGDIIFLTNGKGSLCTGRILETDPRGCRILITGTTENYGARPYRLHIAVAPTKNMDRFEWFVEKATEVGVDIITPLICERSERKKCRTERAERIAVSALKQCKRAQMPEIRQAVVFDEFLRSGAVRETSAAIACCESEVYREPAASWIRNARENILFLIGPEGDFSPEEVSRAMEQGCTPVDLGQSVLRTETAALGAVFLASFK